MQELEFKNVYMKAVAAVPTAANCQPWEFIVIDEAEKLSELKSKFI